MSASSTPIVSTYSEDHFREVQASIKAMAGFPESSTAMKYTAFDPLSLETDEAEVTFVTMAMGEPQGASSQTKELPGGVITLPQYDLLAMLRQHAAISRLKIPPQIGPYSRFSFPFNPTPEPLTPANDVPFAVGVEKGEEAARHTEDSLGALKSHTTAPKSQVPPQPETAHNPTMTEVTRELLDAKLDSVRAEVRASIAESSKETVAAMGQLNTQMATMQGEMLTQMQGLRADFANMLKDVTKEMAATSVAVAGQGEKVANLDAKLAETRGAIQGVNGSIDGLKSSITTLQWVVATAAAVAAIVIGIMQIDLAKNPPTPAAPAAAVTQPAK